MKAKKSPSAGDKDESRREDTPERALTGVEIVAKKRPRTSRTPVPADTGIYVGSGVYANRGRMKMGGFCFTYWEPDKLDYDGIIDLCAKRTRASSPGSGRHSAAPGSATTSASATTSRSTRTGTTAARRSARSRTST